MSNAKTLASGPSTSKKTEADAESEIVVLEDGDAGMAPRDDEPPSWDWESDVVTEGHRCHSCGAIPAPFHLEDGSFACEACHHGLASESSRALAR
jgi:hypothetical protein